MEQKDTVHFSNRTDRGVNYNVAIQQINVILSRDLSFILCGGSESFFRGGGQKKADLIKRRIKFDRNIERGEGITNLSKGDTFLIIGMFYKVLNG